MYYTYTTMIDPEVPKEITQFVNADLKDITYIMLKQAYDIYDEDYIKFPNGSTKESLDIIYEKDHVRFFNKYYKFAKKCKSLKDELYNLKSFSDIEKVFIRETCNIMDYTFPYGWKPYGWKEES